MLIVGPFLIPDYQCFTADRRYSEKYHSGKQEEEFGDVLFAAVGAAVRMEIDPEQALLGANRRFYGRFAHVERGARERGTTIAEMGTGEKLELWESAKSAE